MKHVILFIIMLSLFSLTAIALTTDANKVNGIGVMYHTTPELTTLFKWNGTSITQNMSVPFIRGKSKWLRAESSPTRDQSIIMSDYFNGTGEVIAVVYNGSSFTHTKNISTLLTNVETDRRGFDMGYFRDGTAMLVGHNSSVNGVYQYWNGTNFTLAGSIPFTNCTGIPQFIDFHTGLNGTAFVITQDSNGDVCANAWNGSAWNAPRLLDTTPAGAEASRKTIEVNVESVSGDAILTYETGTSGTIGSCLYTMNTVPFNNGWCSSQGSFLLPNTGDTIFLDSASHRLSDRVLFGYYQNGAGDINVIEWNGVTQEFSNSNVPTLIDGTSEAGGDALVAVAYTGDAGMLVYDDTNADNPSYSMCNSTALCIDGSWNVPALTTGAVNCGEAEDLDFVKLSTNRFNNNVMLIAGDQGAHTKCLQEWNGAGWNTAFTNLEEGAELTTGIDFDFAYDQFLSVGNISKAWITNTSFPSSPATYSTPQEYRYNVSWNLTNFDISYVTMTHDFYGINQTVLMNQSAGVSYVFNIIPLAVGNYSWSQFANTTNGLTNTTDLYQYSVIQAMPVLSFAVTPSLNITEGDVSSVGCSSNTAQVLPILYHEGVISTNPHLTILSCGAHQYQCNSSASQNFTMANASIMVNVAGCANVTIIPPVTTPFDTLLTTARCPNETASRMLVFVAILGFLFLMFIINTLFMRIGIFGILAGMGVILYSFTLMGCSYVMGVVLLIFGVFMAGISLMNGWNR